MFESIMGKAFLIMLFLTVHFENPSCSLTAERHSYLFDTISSTHAAL